MSDNELAKVEDRLEDLERDINRLNIEWQCLLDIANKKGRELAEAISLQGELKMKAAMLRQKGGKA